jgi:hypothetical protein
MQRTIEMKSCPHATQNSRPVVERRSIGLRIVPGTWRDNRRMSHRKVDIRRCRPYVIWLMAAA